MGDLASGIGKRIRDIREERNLTQKALAERAHLAPATLNRVEKGCKGLSLESLERIAAALDVHPAELLRDGSIGEDDPRVLVEGLLARRARDPVERERRLKAALLALFED
jgi:transcriptional regulator with XRE-family HTH domain